MTDINYISIIFIYVLNLSIMAMQIQNKAIFKDNIWQITLIFKKLLTLFSLKPGKSSSTSHSKDKKRDVVGNQQNIVFVDEIKATIKDTLTTIKKKSQNRNHIKQFNKYKWY